MKATFSLLGKTFIGSLKILTTPKERTYGWHSRVKSGQHVIFLDYDRLTLEEVETELLALQKYYNLGDIHIFQCAPDSWHGVCLDLNSLSKTYEIISQTNSDYAHKQAPILYGKANWVLRSQKKGKHREKPKYLTTLRGKQTNPTSTAHRVYMAQNWPEIKLKKYPNEDNNTVLGICAYNTANRLVE